MFCSKRSLYSFLTVIGITVFLLSDIVQARTTVSVEEDGTVVFWTRAKLCGPGIKQLEGTVRLEDSIRLSSGEKTPYTMETLLNELEKSLETHWNDAASQFACSPLRFDFTIDTSDHCETDSPPRSPISAALVFPFLVTKEPGWDTWYVNDSRPGIYDRPYVFTLDPLGDDRVMYLNANEVVRSSGTIGDAVGRTHRTLLHETTHLLTLDDRYEDKLSIANGTLKTRSVCDSGWGDNTIGCDGWRFKKEQFDELSQNVRNSSFSDIVKGHIARSCIIRHIHMNTFDVQKQLLSGLSTTDERIYVRGRFTVSEYDYSTHLIRGEGNMYFTHISPETDQNPDERWRLVGVNPGAFSVKGRLLNNCDIMESPEMCKLELDFDPVGGLLEALYTNNEFTNKAGKVQTIPQHESVEAMFRAGFFDPFEGKLNSRAESPIAIFKIKYEAGGTAISGAGTLRFIDPTKRKPPSPFVPAAVSGGLQ